jgi:hypothetical protein
VSELDNLARLIGPPPGEDIRLVQGVIRSWDPNTFENEVEVDGVIRRNLRVGSGIEALTYQPGDVVLVQQWFPGGRKGELGVGTSWIVGRILTPGTGAAEQAIAFMRTALAQRLSLEVIRARFHQQVGEHVQVTSSSFDDPNSGDPRPVISDVEIVTGVAVVWLSGWFTNLNYPINPNGVGDLVMSVEVSGATFKAPSDAQATAVGRGFSGGDTRPSGRVGSTLIFDDLNPGLHTFTVKYMVTSTMISGTVLSPRMVVLAM